MRLLLVGLGEALVHAPGRLAECYNEHAGMSGEAPGSARG
jgi:hypothetical protein